MQSPTLNSDQRRALVDLARRSIRGARAGHSAAVHARCHRLSAGVGRVRHRQARGPPARLPRDTRLSARAYRARLFAVPPMRRATIRGSPRFQPANCRRSASKFRCSGPLEIIDPRSSGGGCHRRARTGRRTRPTSRPPPAASGNGMELDAGGISPPRVAQSRPPVGRLGTRRDRVQVQRRGFWRLSRSRLCWWLPFRSCSVCANRSSLASSPFYFLSRRGRRRPGASRATNTSSTERSRCFRRRFDRSSKSIASPSSSTRSTLTCGAMSGSTRRKGRGISSTWTPTVRRRSRRCRATTTRR